MSVKKLSHRRRHINRKVAVLFSGMIFFILSIPAYPQTEIKNNFTIRTSAETVIPLFGDSDIFNIGFGGNVSAEYFFLPFLGPSLFGGIGMVPVRSLDLLTLLRGGAGAGLRFRPTDRLSFRGDVYGGLYTTRWRDDSSSGLVWGLKGEAGIRITPALTLSLHAGFADYLSSPEPLLRAFTGGISMTINIGEIGSREPQLGIEHRDLTPIFPVFYSYYDDNSFGSVEVHNREEADIKNVTVSLFIPEYMSQPRVCGSFRRVSKDQKVSVPLYALFNDEVLELTENTKAQADVLVEYRLLGKRMQASTPLELTMYHRNAMTWEDDKKAAAFVSPTDPAVLWFSRFAAGIVRDRLRNDIQSDLQYAMGLFEAMKLYGINYVVDPNSSYVEKSEEETAIDYLQFPHQTLFYRGGDCDDLSILYAALLESVGIETAFITIPGHIYMALKLDIDQTEARELFYDSSMVIFHEGNVWLPVEITMVKEGFVKAWRIGAKEWNDNIKTGTASLFPMKVCWVDYKPAGIPNVNPRFSLPDEAAMIESFDTGINRYVALEILPIVEEFKRNPTGSPEEQDNALGVLFAKHAILDEAWRRFSAAAKAGYPRAWTNLGNVAFLQRDYELAPQYYNWALKLNPDDTISLLGLARCYYELEKLSESETAYARLQEMDPGLASKYGYLTSVLGGEGRAWSFTERLTTTVWAETPALKMAHHDTHLAMGLPEVKIEEDDIPSSDRLEEPEEKNDTASESQAVEPPAIAEAEEPEAVTEPEKPAVERQQDISPETGERQATETAADEETNGGSRPGEAEDESPAVEKKKHSQQEEKPDITPDRDKPEESESSEEEGPRPEPQSEEPEDEESIETEQQIKLAEKTAEPAADEGTVDTEQDIRAAAETETAPQDEEQAPTIAEAPPEDPVTRAAKEERQPQDEEKPPQGRRQVIREAPEVKKQPPPEPGSGDGTSATGRDEGETEEMGEPVSPSVGERDKTPEQPDRVAAAPSDAVAHEVPGKHDTAKEDSAENPGSEIILDDFNAAKQALGSWSVQPDKAVQADPKQLFAKLVVPLHQGKSRMRYSFTARSTGSGWTGLGIHIYRGPVVTHRGYGAGKSILIWVTSDPKHYNNADARLEVYRSLDDINMYRLKSIVIPESIYDANTYVVEIDTNSGTIILLINEKERLKASGFSDFTEGEFIVLRSLDTAEFQNIKVEELQ